MNRFEQAVHDCMIPTAKLLDQTTKPLAVGDWGICDELTFHQLAVGSDLRALGYDVADPAGLYHASSRQAFIWPYDERARLAGENLYEDKTSLRIEKVDPADATTPARVRDIHRGQLARLEQERGGQLLDAGRHLTDARPARRPGRAP